MGYTLNGHVILMRLRSCSHEDIGIFKECHRVICQGGVIPGQFHGNAGSSQTNNRENRNNNLFVMYVYHFRLSPS